MPGFPTSSRPAQRPAADFREAVARLAGGVALLTTLDPIGRDCGLTVTAVSSVSLDPPLALVCVKKDGFVHDALFVADGWSLSMLADDQVELARYGARSRAPGDRDDFTGWPTRRAVHGELVLTSGVAALECEPYDWLDAGDHTIALGRVVRATTDAGDRAALIHVDRRYARPGDVLG
ncbi:flavin reductase (DIM6/NTAB) family NADH-FMN oxidoreductase RutF [Haloactinopolyspora alba]|uniref:Flavin reductase (DIM6/NTAB) family NADH-FMN oxidoreductase RutF n=1 Tax=Haloactinopolyspora alba TaxID=648780 RepID=A0A2P8DV67_9ACTN|nr:flavin reductase (DIM6/NTAB) family NADH-FMN oxidoreductase RutF [Haloactinopolyspora alba]